MTQETAAEDRSSSSRKRGKWTVVAVATVIGALAAVLAIPGVMDLAKRIFGFGPAPAACAAGGASSVLVEADNTTGGSLDYTIRIKCPPADGSHYTTVFELPDQGQDSHTVYYCKESYKDVKPNISSSRKEPIRGGIGSVRRVYVVEILDSESDRCIPDGADNEGVTDPPSTKRVSNIITTTRTS